MSKEIMKEAQKVLAKAKLYRGKIDGLEGPLFREAVWKAPGPRPNGMRTWPFIRQAIAAMQRVLFAAKMPVGGVDGYFGPMTDAAAASYLGGTWNRPSGGKSQVSDWGTEASIREVFGPPAGKDTTAGKVLVPWPMVLAWRPDTEIKIIRCHALVATSLARVFEQVADTHNSDEISALGVDLFGGCYNPRRKRGGASWSTHAYGVALDFDPSRNRLRQKKPGANLSGEHADKWWTAWEAEGWTSLGRAADFDWMHVQAPGL